MAYVIEAPVIQLLTAIGVGEDTEGDVFTLLEVFGRVPDSKTGLVQVEGIVTAETTVVTIQGRMSADYGWVDIIAFAEDSTEFAAEIVLFPQMRAVVSTWESGTIFAGLFI